MPNNKPLPVRFWEKVARRGEHEFWLWRGAQTGVGYGQFNLSKARGQTRKSMSAHRYSFMLHDGIIPPGMEVMHICDTPLCVNPNHLKLGSHAANMADMKAKGRAKGNPALPGSLNHQAKLTEERVWHIRLAIAAKTKLTHIAREYGVDPVVIRRIRDGRAWKHVS